MVGPMSSVVSNTPVGKRGDFKSVGMATPRSFLLASGSPFLVGIYVHLGSGFTYYSVSTKINFTEWMNVLQNS